MTTRKGCRSLVVATLIALAALLLLAIAAQAQDSFWHPPVLTEQQDWCIQHDPCSSFAHGATTFAFSGLAGWLTPLEADEARWIPLVYYTAKEVRDNLRWGSLFSENWDDAVLDMALTGVGFWAAGEVWGSDEDPTVAVTPSGVAVGWTW